MMVSFEFLSVEIKNQADALIYTSEKALRDGGDKVPADVKSEIENKIAELKKIKDGESIEEIKNKTEELSRLISKIGEALYKKDAGGREAEYEDVNKEEKKDDNKS